MDFETVDLSIIYGTSNEVWVSIVSRIGAVHGVLRKGLAISSLKEAKSISAKYRDIARQGYCDPEFVRRIGCQLRELLFGDQKLSTLFIKTRAVAQEHKRTVLARILASPMTAAALP